MREKCAAYSPVIALHVLILKPIRQKFVPYRKFIVETGRDFTCTVQKRIKRAKLITVAILATAVLISCPQYISASQDTQSDCRIDAGPCTKTTGILTVSFDIAPKPVKAMGELTFTVTVKERGKPVKDASLLIDLTMPGMYMGRNVVRLTHSSGGVYEGKGVIVRCPSGGTLWQASVVIQHAEKKSVVSYTFEVP
jgi:YtkA-like